MKQYWLCASLCVVGGWVQAQSLEQAVVQTLESHPDIRHAHNEWLSRQQELKMSKGYYLPSLDLEAGIGRDKYRNEFDPQGSFDPKYMQISLRQLIWDGGYTWNDIDRHSFEVKAQRYHLLADAQDIALKTAGYYLSVLEAQEALRLAEENTAVHNKILKNIEKRTRGGISASSDLTQAKGRFSRAQASLAVAQANLRDKITQFIGTVGRYPKDLVKPEIDQNYLPTSFNLAIDLAKKHNPVMQLAYQDINAAKAQHDQASGAFYPHFSAEASQRLGDELDGAMGRHNELSILLKLNYNLFRGGSDYAKLGQTSVRLDQAKNVRDKSNRMLEESTRLAWSAMTLIQQQAAYLKDHVEAASLTVRAYRKQFRLGKRTLLDVLNTENELFESRKAFLHADYDGILAKYRLLNATGLLLDKLRVDVQPDWVEPKK